MTNRSFFMAMFLGVLCLPALVSAQYSGLFGFSEMQSASPFFKQGGEQTPVSPALPKGFERPTYFTLGLRKYINSFTSFQMPALPITIYYPRDPMSRLEFPWEQTFGVVKLGSYYGPVHVNFEGAATLFTYSGLPGQDSDWAFEDVPDNKSHLSEGKDLPRCWTFDTSIGYTSRSLPSVQWLLGYRIQQFRFTYSDITQHVYERPPVLLPSIAIEFSEFYKIWYFGAALHSQLPYHFSAKLTGDVGSVTANSADYHPYNPRFVTSSTNGICWHVNLTLQFWHKGVASVGLAGDLMKITTNGQGHYSQLLTGTDVSWDGIRAWSEQKYIEANASILF